MKNFLKQKNRAFTLVETLVAISIFSMSILALMSVLSQGVSDTGYAKEKIIASYLAQEGIEYIRNMRDTNVLYSGNGNAWNNFKAKLSPCNQDVNGNDNKECGFDDSVFPNDIFRCSSSDCKLYLNNGSYASSGSAYSGFTRKIWADTSNTDEIKIYSTVFWTQKSGNYSVTFSESLFNWVE